ncbi:MAG: hypothetical protein K0R66_998 [Gammaproteobacteria bacterium]|nr:hypothetical protein [Gammaproteobacteria bacterium]
MSLIPESYAYSGSLELNNMEAMVNYNEHIIKLLERSKVNFDRVVDFGAGIGTLAKIVKPKCNNLICIELDSKQRELLVQQGFQAFESIDSIPDNSQSLIYSSNVIEHIEDDYAAVKAIYQKLQVGGKAFFYIPAFSCLYSAMDRKVGHFRRYDKNRLQDIMKKANFHTEEIYFADSLGFFIALLFKHIDKSGQVNPKSLKIYDKLLFPISCILDYVLKYFLGKNLVVVVSKH